MEKSICPEYVLRGPKYKDCPLLWCLKHRNAKEEGVTLWMCELGEKLSMISDLQTHTYFNVNFMPGFVAGTL